MGDGNSKAITVKPPDTAALKREFNTLKTYDVTSAIQTPEDCENRWKAVNALATWRKLWEEKFAPAKASAQLTVKLIRELFQDEDNQAEALQRAGKDSIAIWEERQEQELRRLEAEQREAAERIAAQQRMEELAALNQRKGSTPEQAEKLLAQPLATPLLPKPVMKKPKTGGGSVAKVWKWEVVDMTKVPRKYLLLNVKVLNRMATTMGELAEVEGVRFYQAREVRSGSS
jgi:NADH dehydrogenase/NADH:ubiquinone oxidoreductase subunit G